MHRDIVTHILASTKFDFLFSASVDGHIKFWRKVVQGVEFVKTYRAHMAAISDFALSQSEERLASCCPQEQSLKIFDVVNFDLINMVKLDFTPLRIQFVNKATNFSSLLAVSDQDSPAIKLVKAEMSLVERRAEGAQVVLRSTETVHDSPVSFLKFNKYGGYCLSFASNVPEIWDPETMEIPQ